MKRLIVALMLVFGISCAGTMSNKCDVNGPPPAPTQEELLAKAAAENKVKEFDAFWEKERFPLGFYLTSETGVPLTLTREELVFVNNYKVALVYAAAIDMTTNVKMMNIYVVCTHPGEWQVAQIVAEMSEEAKKVIDEAEKSKENSL